MTEYRYTLTRTLPPGPRRFPGTLVWVMLNPSTATEEVDDATIRRVKAFTAREGYGHLEVVNLYAKRATRPVHLLDGDDPIGPANGDAIMSALRRAVGVVAAWGTWPTSHTGRPGFHEPPNVAAMCSALGVSLWCLGKTKDGSPMHPLYRPANAPLIPWP